MIEPARSLTADEYEAYYKADDVGVEWDEGSGADRRTHYVYRYWSDRFPEGKRLLYVGCTQEFNARDAMHWCSSWWRHLATRHDLDVYPRTTRREARLAEARTIRDEVPLFNIHKNPRHAAVHGSQWSSAHVEPLYQADLQRLLMAAAS
jgi:hypothetical protein